MSLLLAIYGLGGNGHMSKCKNCIMLEKRIQELEIVADPMEKLARSAVLDELERWVKDEMSKYQGEYLSDTIGPEDVLIKLRSMREVKGEQ
jgi:hypothetical protein